MALNKQQAKGVPSITQSPHPAVQYYGHSGEIDLTSSFGRAVLCSNSQAIIKVENVYKDGMALIVHARNTQPRWYITRIEMEAGILSRESAEE